MCCRRIADILCTGYCAGILSVDIDASMSVRLIYRAAMREVDKEDVEADALQATRLRG